MTAQPLAAAAGPGGMFEAPSYVTPDGRASEDPLQLSGRDPVVDLAGLALMLSSPALELEFMPASLWRGLTLRRLGLPLAAHGSDPAGTASRPARRHVSSPISTMKVDIESL